MTEQDIKDMLFYLDEAEELINAAHDILDGTNNEWDKRSMSFALWDPRGQRNAFRNVKTDIDPYLAYCRSTTQILLEMFEDIRFFLSGVFTIKNER